MGDRGSGRGPSWSVERRPGTGPSRAETRPRQAPGRRAATTGRRTRQSVERRPLLAVEEPGEPQREPADQARLDRRDRPQAVPGLPPQRGPAADLHDALRRRRRGPRAVDQLGPTLPDLVVREAAEAHRQAPGEDPRGDRAQPVQRPDRVDQHQDPADHQDGVRVQVPRGPHRPRPAQPRRPPTRPPRPKITHGWVRRARNHQGMQGGDQMKIYDITVPREGKWWMIDVPAIDGLTQARRLSEIKTMAVSLIAVTLDVPASQVGVNVVAMNVDGTDLVQQRDQIEAERKAAHE